jgi:toxin ParE1/3/4
VAQLSWSLIAVDNLQAVAEYIERDSPLYAAAFVQRVFDAAAALKAFPNMGRIVPEYEDASLRELLFHGYRIVYGIDGDSVRILLVLHAARDLQARFPREAWDLQ